jgi:hydrogenase maturation protein HypF
LLGVMLPYTPLHHLLLHDLNGRPLVLTSGNQSDEPIAFRDEDALLRLRGIADCFLLHDRPIHLRCDDSVTRVVAGEELPLRRSRGYAPQPLTLPRECPRPTLALGGQLKATFALGRGKHAFCSHHLGDLDHYEAFRAYGEAVAHYERLFDFRSEILVHDLHPDYSSTRYAREREQTSGVRLLAVQHHHAHMASCMAEHGLDEPVVGVAFDGTGYGTDGTVWGGEFLVGDCGSFRRAAHLRPVAMPGGEQAIRDPWRMALAYLADAGGERGILDGQVSAAARRTIEQLIARRFQAPLTSSAGRLFDGVAALAGVRQRVSYEGQAAIELEWLAATVPADGDYPFELAQGQESDPTASCLVVDTRPLIAAVADDVRRSVAAACIARRFHTTVVEMIVQVCRRLRGQTGLDAVVLSGGVFLNALLTEEATARLAADGFRVYRHRRVPPNDGGLSLGQLAVAAACAP